MRDAADFEEESGASIGVDRKVNEKDQRVVTIVGETEQQVEEAEILVRQAVGDYHGGGAKGGRGGD